MIHLNEKIFHVFFTETSVYDYRTVKEADTVKFMKYHEVAAERHFYPSIAV
jgi:hypothetical protein